MGKYAGEKELTTDEYQPEFNTNTEFFTSYKPDVVMFNFDNFINDCSKSTVTKSSDEKYKMNFSWKHEVKNRDPDGNLTLAST